MPIVSKYSQQQQDQLLEEVLAPLENNQVPVDLCMMTLGNAVSNVINRGISADKREAVAEQFSRILLQSVQSSKK
ncbi:hypothetical protein CWE09_03945 [Aliidiomarina minuta]|uniref:UPF0352 protein CWE09_03945 n=1 Tax=Aliidiomarina minuta TaxID=880057 RepID=A0A432WAN4_9GAMM|nr:DUF1414 domain-containing protein [Aliidiomarina minuta]RUO27101.1 hypothetical protein CWE09_03945 [Aliidiomarina minuta]